MSSHFHSWHFPTLSPSKSFPDIGPNFFFLKKINRTLTFPYLKTSSDFPVHRKWHPNDCKIHHLSSSFIILQAEYPSTSTSIREACPSSFPFQGFYVYSCHHLESLPVVHMAYLAFRSRPRCSYYSQSLSYCFVFFIELITISNYLWSVSPTKM